MKTAPVDEKHLNVSPFGLIEEEASEADALLPDPGCRGLNDYGGVVLDLESLRRWRADCQNQLSCRADALSRKSAHAVEEERRKGNALLQDAARDNHQRRKGC